MARFDKSSTKRPKQNAAVAAASGRQALDRAVDRGHDVLPAAAAPRQVDVRLPRGRPRRRLRPLRRRRRRHRRRRHLPRQRQLERRAVDLERAEEDGAEPEGRRRPGGTSSTALQTDGQTDRGDRRPEQVVGAGAEGRRRASRARRPLPVAGDGEAAGRAARSSSGPRTPAPAQGFPGSLVSATGQSLVDDKISVDAQRAGSRGDPDAASRTRRRRRRRPSTRTSRSSRCSRTTRTSSSSSPRRPSRPATRRPRSPPTRRS